MGKANPWKVTVKRPPRLARTRRVLVRVPETTRTRSLSCGLKSRPRQLQRRRASTAVATRRMIMQASAVAGYEYPPER